VRNIPSRGGERCGGKGRKEKRIELQIGEAIAWELN